MPANLHDIDRRLGIAAHTVVADHVEQTHG